MDGTDMWIWDVTEIDVHRRGRTGTALTGIPFEAY